MHPRTLLEPAEPAPYREPLFSLRRPSRAVFSRFIANVLVRLLIVSALPANLQAAAALFPVSILWPLVAPDEPAPTASGPENRVRGYQPENAPLAEGEASQAAEVHRGYELGYGGVASDRLYNAKARFYDPTLGRFISQDSYLGEADDPPSLHRYFYANDRPTFFVDPTGHQAAAPAAPYLIRHYIEEFNKKTEPVGDALHALERSEGALVGYAKFLGHTALDTIALATGYEGEDYGWSPTFGEDVVDAARDPRKAAKNAAQGLKDHANRVLDETQERLLAGDHVGAATVFTEKLSAPTTTAAVTVVEGGSVMTRNVVRRAVSSGRQLRAAAAVAAERQALQAREAMARAVLEGRRGEIGAVGGIMTREEAAAALSGEATVAEGAEVSTAAAPRSAGGVAGHHTVPEYMGGRPNQPLADLANSTHAGYHEFLDNWALPEGMQARSPAPRSFGGEVRPWGRENAYLSEFAAESQASREFIIKNLRESYKSYGIYDDVAEVFEKEAARFIKGEAE